jgi:predicted nuclease with TOPRIM domain
MTELVGFVVAAGVGLVLSIATLFLTKKSGLGEVQDALIQTMQENTVALTQRVDLLEAQVKDRDAKIEHLEAEVKKLGDTVLRLSKDNTRLKKLVGEET